MTRQVAIYDQGCKLMVVSLLGFLTNGFGSLGFVYSHPTLVHGGLIDIPDEGWLSLGLSSVVLFYNFNFRSSLSCISTPEVDLFELPLNVASMCVYEEPT